MKTVTTQRAAIKRAAHTTSSFAAPRSLVRSAPSDQVWPGLTRAQLRDIVIEQIG